MQTGMINSENHSQIMRSISQKRQNGILEVLFSDRQVLIFFVNGKIVEAVDSSHNSVEELQSILQKVGFTKPSNASDREYSSYKDLFLAINSEIDQKKVLDENTFRMALKRRVLDAIYDLRLDVPAVYNLKLQMVDYDRDFSPSISVGQVLLDRVSLESEYSRFITLFPEDALIKRNEPAGISLSEEEQIIFNVIGDGISKKALSEQVLLSRYSIQHNLLSMYDRALVEVEAANKIEDSQAQPISDDILSVLEESSDRPFVESNLKPISEEKCEIQEKIKASNNGAIVSSPKNSEAILEQAPENNISEDIEENGDFEEEHFGYAKISKLAILNGQLLQSQYIPNIIIFIFMVLACTMPFYLWHEIFAGF